MTTTTAAPPVPTRISWIPILWIGAIHAGALLAVFPSYFSWSGLAVCVFLHWLTGGIGICMTYHRLLTHRSFAVRPRWLEYVLTIIGNCTRRGARSAGSPIIAATTPIPTRKFSTPTPRSRASSGPTWAGG